MDVITIIIAYCNLSFPVLEAHLAALATDPDPMQENSCLQDEQSNASCLFALLEGILGQGKGSGGRPDPPHLCLITAALCALPHFVGSTTAQFFNLAAICSAATLFHWFTGSEWSVSVLCDESCDKSQPSSQIIQSPIEVAQRNSAALRSLVRSSGGFAKKARPANPDSIPAALIDISTVEQLVSSTTSDPADPHTSADQHQDERLLDELACSAALAIVDSNGGNVSSGVQTIHVFPKLPYTSPSQEPDAGSLSMNSFFLNKNAEISSGSNFHRNPVYATFKMPSPSKEPTQSSIPRIESSSCINPSNADKSAPASPAQDVVSTTQSHTPQYNQLTSTQVSTPTSRSSWQRNAGRGKTK
ncbi:unnamed protein product [Mesocestoides corti]|uniref:Uncharacterized protein n=1 Tax=Mesocestoides corti TaxID=53468 RepID=A0A0R3U1W0_MESCO|nr:unnamed protein product [Mesocestoides corti]